MSRILYLLLSVALFACNTGTRPSKADLREEQAIQHLLARYKKVSFDSLKVYPASDLEDAAYRFKGKALDTNDVRLLPTGDWSGDTGVFGCFRFRLDSTRWGLLTRVPSYYESTSIRIFIYDQVTKKITDGTQLAETWGDEGDSFQQESWIYKEKTNGWNICSNLSTGYDHSVNDANDTTYETKEMYYLFRINQQKVDTIRQEESLVAEKWNTLNRHTKL
ncbi:hypothetical protein [Chitinophaga sp. Cy-1792]|uniref:hypothetical protein n=1 Tax=Chitinophaga sp. Cy-1792 TaxID=2608339 RepID=UPI001420DF66|nr:hypothetical protein [Chitinophaga sp. Cy-1792]NIG56696.1 hypothetical protein [Chitinophaga sp. Cy-1792]